MGSDMISIGMIGIVQCSLFLLRNNEKDGYETWDIVRFYIVRRSQGLTSGALGGIPHCGADRPRMRRGFDFPCSWYGGRRRSGQYQVVGQSTI
jgi:hypothetical protein